MSKEKKESEKRAEIGLHSLLKLVENGTATIRVDGEKHIIKLDLSDLDDDEEANLWDSIATEAEDCARDCEEDGPGEEEEFDDEEDFEPDPDEAQ